MLAPMFRDNYQKSLLSEISVGILSLVQISSFICEIYYLLVAGFDRQILKSLLITFVSITAVIHYGLLLWRTINLIRDERNPDGSTKPEYFAIFCFHPVFWIISFARVDLGMLLCDSSFTNFLLVFVYYTRRFEDAAALRLVINCIFQTIPCIILQFLNNLQWRSFEIAIMGVELAYLLLGLTLLILYMIDRRNHPQPDYEMT
jgi:hypothetical protein